MHEYLCPRGHKTLVDFFSLIGSESFIDFTFKTVSNSSFVNWISDGRKQKTNSEF